MKSKPAQSDASEPKGGGRGTKRAAGNKPTDGKPTGSKTPRDNTHGETPGTGAPPQGKSVHSNILHHIYRSKLGQSLHTQMRQCLQEPFIRSLSSYHFHSSTSPFDRRITCLEWNPAHHSTMAVASKGGDICLWDYLVPNRHTFIKGMGAGDSVTDMKFNPLNPSQLFTSSMCGTTSLRDFTGATVTVFASTDTYNGAGDFIGGMKFCPSELSKVYVASGNGTLTLQSFQGLKPTTLSRTQECFHVHHNVCFWFCCVDVSVSRKMLVTGDNVGRLQLLGLDGTKIFNNKMHKAKVTHTEFNPRCDWLLATASVDHTVALWDLRNMKDDKSILHKLPHEKAVNSAYFNPLDCSKLLTTDQYDEIRIYSSCDWSKPQRVIQHPHRQFQHLTPIKATWHPTYDIIVAGCYPDNRVCAGDQRTLDFYDSNRGALVYQMYDPMETGIKSINKFNPLGDVIASGMGMSVLVWDRDESLMDCEDTEPEETSTSAVSLRRPRRQSQPRTRTAKEKKKTTPVLDPRLKKKLEEAETKTKTQRRKK